MKYKTYIFDFDYTLADATVGMTLGNILFTLTGISDKGSAEQFISHFMYMADKVITNSTVLFPDTISVLSQLKERCCNTAIVTTKVRYRVEEALSKYDIVGLIDYIAGLEDVTAPKPSPEGILKAISYFGSDKHDVLFIGDSLLDANAAAGADVDFAAVLTGATPKQDFLSLPHILIAKSLTEIIEHTC